MTNKKYADHDPLYPIERGYNESTRMLMFHSTPIEADKLQEALDLIGTYNEFDSKIVGRELLKQWPNAKFVVGREYSPCVYVITGAAGFWGDWLETFKMVRFGIHADEMGEKVGTIRFWWD